jgi:hypothetical protein
MAPVSGNASAGKTQARAAIDKTNLSHGIRTIYCIPAPVNFLAITLYHFIIIGLTEDANKTRLPNSAALLTLKKSVFCWSVS